MYRDYCIYNVGDHYASRRAIRRTRIFLKNDFIRAWLPHHEYMYDKKSLEKKMKVFGLIIVNSFKYGCSDKILDIRDVEGIKESYLSVYMEALNPV